MADHNGELPAVELVVQQPPKETAHDSEKKPKHSDKRIKRWLRAIWTVLVMQSWTDFLCAVCFAIALILIMNNATPVYRPIQSYDATLSYIKNSSANVPYLVVMIVPYVLLVFGVAIVEFGITPRSGVRWIICGGRFLHFVLHGLYTQVFAIFMVELTKPIVGYPRPTFLSVCQPPASANGNVTFNPAGTTCTNTDQAAINDARESFVSGHSTTAMAVMVYLIIHLLWSLYATPRRRMFRFRSRWSYFWWDALHTLSLLYLLGLFLYGWFMAITRIVSNNHAPADVVGGMLLGLFVGLLYGPRAIGRAKYLTDDLTTLYEA